MTKERKFLRKEGFGLDLATVVHTNQLEELLKKYKEQQLTLTDVVVPKETLPNNCKGCGRTIEEMGKMTSMCGVSACPNY
jgi:hypothetical protein